MSAIDWDAPKKERDCPLCGTETVVKKNSKKSWDKRECPNPDCHWWLLKGGRWTSPQWGPEDVTWLESDDAD